MKVLLLDKNLVDPINHEKWDLLASRKGMTIKAVAPTEWVENSRVLGFSSSPNTKFPIVPLRVRWPGYENRAFYVGGLGGEMRSFRPDVILCFEEPFSLFALQATILRRFYAHQSKLIFYSWDNIAKGRNYAYRPACLYTLIERFVMRQSSLLLTANEEGKVYYEHAYSTVVKKLYFGVKLDGEDAHDDSIMAVLERFPSGSFLLGYVGRLLEMKGVETLIQAVALLNWKVRLVIVGSGPDEPRLRVLVADHGLSSRVTFISAVSSSHARLVMRHLDVLVLPSRTTKKWKEQYGRVLIESMALGVPVIGSDSGAIPEVVGDCGLIFHEGDAESLAGAIKMLMSDETLRNELSRKGIVRSREFSAETFADRLHDILLELAS